MIILKSFLAVLLIHSFVNGNQRCRNCTQRKAELPVEQLRQLRYEYLKEQILNKLHLSEPPNPNLPKPPLRSILAIAEMAENETIFETDDQPKTETVVIYPRNDNSTCEVKESYPCSRFEFAVPESLFLDNLLSAEVWFYNDTAKYIRVYIIITNYMQNLTSSFELENIAKEKNIKPWSKYNVPSNMLRSNLTFENILVLEVTYDMSETILGSTIRIVEMPFLVLHSEELHDLSRKKRNPSCGESSTSCCKENFYLNFSEIGWDNWILHPDGYQANFCRGRCFNDLSNTRFYHSAVLLSYIRDNKDIAEEIGLNMCCTPSVMAPVTIIYRNEEGLIYHKSIDNMKVEACDCA